MSNNILEAVIRPCNTGGYQIHGKFINKVNAPCDEGLSFQNVEIKGLSCQVYESGFRIMSAREYQLSFIVRELGEVLQALNDIPQKKGLSAAIRKDFDKFVKEDLGLKV